MFNLSRVLVDLQSTMYTIVGFLFVLTLVVIIHELGHFLVARWCGVKVDAFAMGFGREIWGFNDSKGTRWRLNWLPLGGYVKFMDDANGASIPDADAIARMTEAERRTSFHGKALWQRAAVIFAGPLANFLLAVVIFTGLFIAMGILTFPPRVDEIVPGSPAAQAGMRAGDVIRQIGGSDVTDLTDILRVVSTNPNAAVDLTYERGGKLYAVTVTPERKEMSDDVGGTVGYGDIGITFPARVKDVDPGSPADRAGLKAGDVIREIAGQRIADFTGLQKVISMNAGHELAMTIDRSGQKLSVQITPASVEVKDAKGVVAKIGRIGLRGLGGPDPADGVWRRPGPVEALSMGVKESYFVIAQSLSGLSKIAQRQEDASQLGGPLKIAAVAGKAAQRGFESLLRLAALISLSVGLFNLFPIPPLDGGHLLFYAGEALRGRPLSDHAKDVGLRMGLALIVMLIMLVMWNDRLVVRTWLGG